MNSEGDIDNFDCYKMALFDEFERLEGEALEQLHNCLAHFDSEYLNQVDYDHFWSRMDKLKNSWLSEDGINVFFMNEDTVEEAMDGVWDKMRDIYNDPKIYEEIDQQYTDYKTVNKKEGKQ